MTLLEHVYHVNSNSFGLGQSIVMVLMALIVMSAYLIFFKWSKTVLYVFLMELGIGIYMTLFLVILNTENLEMVYRYTQLLYSVFLVHSVIGAFAVCYINPYHRNYFKYLTSSFTLLMIGLIYISDTLVITRKIVTNSFNITVKGPLIIVFFSYMFLLAGILAFELFRLRKLDRKVLHHVWPIYIGLIFLTTFSNFVGIYMNKHPNGKIYIYFNAVVFTLLIIFYLAREVKRNIEERDEILKRYSCDELTKVHSRSYIFEQVEIRSKRRRQSKGYIAIIDLDGFKVINDTHGHKVGDEVLIELGKVFNELESDNILAGRIGGDEFMVFFQNISKEEVLGHLEDLKTSYRKISGKYDAPNQVMSLSVGISEVQKDLLLEDIVAYADAMMYREKISKNIQLS